MPRLFEVREDLPLKTVNALRIGAIAVLVLAWIALTAKPFVKPLFLPSPMGVFHGTRQLLLNQGLIINIGISLWRIAEGFLISAVVAVPLGVFMGTFRSVEAFFEPLTGPMRYMPITAFIPLLLVWTTNPETMKIAFLFLGIFFYLLPLVIQATKNVREELLHTAYTLGANRRQVFTTVILPAAAPDIFDAMRVLNGIGWTYVLLVEVIRTSEGANGIGYLMNVAQRFARTDQVFAGIIIIALVGMLSDWLIQAFNRRLFAWRYADAK